MMIGSLVITSVPQSWKMLILGEMGIGHKETFWSFFEIIL